jgi:hypothetical protein
MPRWTEADLDAAKARIDGRKPSVCGEGGGASAEPQRTAGCKPVAAKEPEEGNPTRFWIRIESVRKRLLDEDNLYGGTKYWVDCLRYAGVIPQDTPGIARIEAVQRKARKGETPATYVRVWEIGKVSGQP